MKLKKFLALLLTLVTLFVIWSAPALAAYSRIYELVDYASVVVPSNEFEYHTYLSYSNVDVYAETMLIPHFWETTKYRVVTIVTAHYTNGTSDNSTQENTKEGDWSGASAYASSEIEYSAYPEYFTSTHVVYINDVYYDTIVLEGPFDVDAVNP